MKIWILGKDGLLGKELISKCREKRIPFVATSRQEADITDLKQLLQFAENKEITHIVNCAAYTNVDEAENHPENAYRINSDGPENLGIVARKLGLKLVHISTDYVFNGENEEPYKESDDCSPVGIYAHSKWLGENRLLAQFPTACIIRTSWLFGKGGKNFISSILSHLKEKEELRIVSDQRGRPTFVRDLAENILALLCHSGIFHFANSGAYSRFELAQAVKAEADSRGIIVACRSILPVSSNDFPTRARRPASSVLCTQKIEKLLGKAPRTWEEILKEYITHEC
jgi:dTDP-4-dehydrorhamnose reductase